MIREAVVSDAEEILALTRRVEEESSFMLYGAGERNSSLESMKKMLETFAEKKNATIFVAERDNRLVGYLIVNGGEARRLEHSAYIVIGIVSSYQGKGIGSALFSEMEKWARRNSIHRLELTTAVPNEAGVALYRKAGFEIEGIKKDSMRISGEFINEYYMAKLLDSE
ncbi:N-acetyltransferase family protein [Virgibacillus flavescens]|uniref:GNAT family N-acetyltransferase n=1 Tax=Virgibacillus flavescens TaxID=1611422 RepID=UPI003D34DEBE